MLEAGEISVSGKNVSTTIEGRKRLPSQIRVQRGERDDIEKLRRILVAARPGMSATYFSGKFKEATGINFVDYLARTRVEKARLFFLDSTRRVSEVAFEVGFQSLSQFNRTFKKVVGESPSAYRAKLPLADS